MERLTERTADGISVKEDYGEDVLKTIYQCYGVEPMPHYANCDEGYCAMEKLAEYEDLEEKGKLLKLPCTVGDTVYVISRMDIIPVEVIGVNMFLLNSKMVIQFNGFCDTEMWNMHFTGDDIGRNVFLTQKEADEALERMVE